MAIKRDSLALLKSWTSELESAMNRVRNLIGDAHWLTDGKHKEALLTNFLKKYSFGGYIFSTGFIVSHHEMSVPSGEIDILVANLGKGVPWLFESGLLICPPECVIAHIHVKSSYRLDDLKDVFKSVGKANRSLTRNGALSAPNPTWSSGFFFNSSSGGGLNLDTLEKNIKSCLAEVAHSHDVPNGIYIFPDIAVQFDLNEEACDVKISKVYGLSVALFLSAFHEVLSAKGASELGDLLYLQVASETKNFIHKWGQHSGQ